MSVEENLRMIERWTEAYNAHDFEGFAKPFTESALYHAPNLPEPLEGREEIRRHFSGHPATFPDTRVSIERSFGQGDVVCAEVIWTATHEGPLSGPGGQTVPPTNKSVRLPIAAVFKFEKGKITEAREYWDQAAFMTQLGLSP